MQIKQTLVALATVAAIAGCSNSSEPTRTGSFRNQGYLLDTAGNNAVVKSLGYDVCVRTGDWTPARAIVECDPDLVPKPAAKAPVAPPPPVEPPPAPPQPPMPAPAPQHFTLSADTLFDFDKTTLKTEGRRKLDELADALRGKPYEGIIATGHTDRIGSVRYNQRLSERRAETVKKYLESKGLDGGKITAVGKGKTQPVTKPTDCRSPRMTKAAIHACLQPDRRVDIEVNGSAAIQFSSSTPSAAPMAPEAKPAARPARRAVRAKARAAARAKAKAEAAKPAE